MGATSIYGGHVCEHCARKLPTHIPADPSVMTAGAYGQPSMALARSEPQPIPPSPAGGCVMCQVGNPGATGVAYVGGPSGGDSRYLGVVGSVEPLPVGVIRTNYNQITDSSSPSARATYDPYMPAQPSMAPTSGLIPAPMGAPMDSPGRRHTSVLAHMLGFRRHTRMSEAHREHEREAHAMIRYNSNEAPPAQLPASMVYPR
jgi:hypothetical protein